MHMYTFQDTFHTYHLPKHLYVWSNTAFSRIYRYYFPVTWSRGHAILVCPLVPMSLSFQTCQKLVCRVLSFPKTNAEKYWCILGNGFLVVAIQKYAYSCRMGHDLQKCERLYVSKHKLSQLIHSIPMVFSMKEYGALSMFKTLLHISWHFTVI